jgi:alpha-tubulin suppressor-like RCC1 family protein
VNASHVAAISQDDSLVTWGYDQDRHFEGLEYKDYKDGSSYGSLKLKWKNVIYKPMCVSSRGPTTAVVGAAPKIIGTGKLDDVRKILFLIQNEFNKQTYDSYFDLFSSLLTVMGKEGDEGRGNSLEQSKKDSGNFASLGLTNLEQDGTVEEVEDSKIIPEKELAAKKEIELVKKYDSEIKDDGFMDQILIEKVLANYFNLKPRECESFLYEIQKQAAHKDHSRVSIRAIKDAIYNARLDEGRIFIFTNKANKSSLPLKLHKIGDKPDMFFLYCPDIYEPIASVACGSSHVLLLTRSGMVYSCGDSSQGVLGLGHVKRHIEVPMPVVIKKHKGVRSIKMIAAGREHSMCLTTHNEIFTWGSGIQGKLGHGNEAEQNLPKEIVGISQHTPIYISAGESHSACVTASGKLFTWGDGQYGKLGHGSTQPELAPLQVAGLEDVEISVVSCGSFHTLAVDRTGKAWSFGQPKSGILGYINAERTDLPLMIKGLDRIKNVVAGMWNSFAIDTRGKVYSWGSMEKKMLGRAVNPEELHIPKAIDWIKVGKGVELKSEIIKDSSVSTKVAQIICSYSNTFTVTDAGEVFVLGSNEYGQCGTNPERDATFKKPFKIQRFTVENNCQVKVLSCGFSHVLAATTEGKLYAWGANDCGQLGNGRKNAIYEPTLVDAFKRSRVLFCACGDDYSAVINENEELLTFGSHEKGRLGIGPVDEHGCELIPRKVEQADFPHIKYICCGVNHVLAIPDYDSESADAPKGVWSWGISSRGQLGHNNRRTLYAPQLIQKLAKEKIKKVCCGFEHSMALTESGNIYYWGAQEHYIRSELGDKEDKLLPVIMQPTAIDKVLDIASNHMYNLAIGDGKDVVYWGSFLAASKESKSNIAIVIESKLGIKAEQISCGPNHAGALGFGDSLYTWGYDTEGSLGLNLHKKQYQRTPEKVWRIKEIIDNLKKTKQVSLAKAEETDNQSMKDEKEPIAEEPEEETPMEEDKKKAGERKAKGKGIISESKVDSKAATRGKDASKLEPKKEGEQTKDDKQERGKKVQKKSNKDRAHTKINDLPENANALMIHKSFTSVPSLNQERLIKSQRKVSKMLTSVLDLFKTIAEMAKHRKLMIKSFIINMIIRLENPPFDQKRKFHLIQKESKVLKRIKKHLKEIFKALYLHPCYLIDMIRKKYINTELAGTLINSLFINNLDDKYSKVLLMNFAILILRHEVIYLISNRFLVIANFKWLIRRITVKLLHYSPKYSI